MTEATPGLVAQTADGMPMLGLGTWRLADPSQCAETVRTAVDLGYRHVDTATLYRNESAVGEGLRAAAVDPDEVFVATKVWHSDLAYDDAIESAETSREALGVGSIDLLYVHWPAGAYDPERTLAAFADLRDDGVIERVGVSNFEPTQLREAVEVCDAPIVANQVECHPRLPQAALRRTCEELGINVVGYAPLARGGVVDVPALSTVADRVGATEAQVSLAWLLEKGVAPIPKATGEDHLRENFESLSVDLDDAAVAAVDDIARRDRTVDASIGPW